jgi:hypothetical protein
MSDYIVQVIDDVNINVTVENPNLQTVIVEQPVPPTIITVATVQQGPSGPVGPQGPQGIQGPQGDSFQETFESVSKNLNSWGYVLNYSSGILTSIVYTLGPSTITKTLTYTSGLLTSIVLSGDTPSGITLTKTLNYTSGVLTSITYS